MAGGRGVGFSFFFAKYHLPLFGLLETLELGNSLWEINEYDDTYKKFIFYISDSTNY